MEPPEPLSFTLGVAALVTAGIFGAACTVIGGVSPSRQAALLETLTGSRKRAWERYVLRRPFAHARWFLLQGAGLALSVALLTHASVPWPIAALATVFGTFLLVQLIAATAQGNSERFAPAFVQLVGPLGLLAAPFTDPVLLMLRSLATKMGSTLPPALVTETEVEFVVTEGEQSGALDHGQSEMIRNVIEFGDTHAGDLMVPRTQVHAIDIATPPAELLRIVAEQEHSRYPVYQDRIDNVVGILHLKDLFLFTSAHKISELKLPALLRKAAFVPESQLASSVLQEMRAGRHHMAIVIDEYGGMSGIVTLEDLLEEIVGDIRDEYDDEDPPIVPLGDGHFVVDASVPIADLNREAGLELPDGGDYNSLGGFIVEVMGRVPEPGDVLEQEGHRFLIKTADERHISKVEISPDPPASERTELQASA